MSFAFFDFSTTGSFVCARPPLLPLGRNISLGFIIFRLVPYMYLWVCRWHFPHCIRVGWKHLGLVRLILWMITVARQARPCGGGSWMVWHLRADPVLVVGGERTKEYAGERDTCRARSG